MFKNILGWFRGENKKKDALDEKLKKERLLIEPSLSTISFYRKHCRYYSISDITSLKERVNSLKINLLPHLEHETAIRLVKDFITLTEEKIKRSEKAKHALYSAITDWCVNKKSAFRLHSRLPDFDVDGLLEFINYEIDDVREYLSDHDKIDIRLKNLILSYKYELLSVKDMINEFKNEEMN